MLMLGSSLMKCCIRTAWAEAPNLVFLEPWQVVVLRGAAGAALGSMWACMRIPLQLELALREWCA